MSTASTLLLSFVFFLSGVSALVFETLWFRQAGLAFGASVWASALVLSSFMTGIAIGNGFAARYGGSIRRPLVLYAGLEVWIGLVGLGLVVVLPELTPPLAYILNPLEAYPTLLRLARFVLAFVLLLGPAVAMGATLPLLVKTLFGEGDDFGRLLGRLYGINTLGAVVGAITSEFFLIPRVGVLGSGFAAAGMSALAAGLAIWAARGAVLPSMSSPVAGRDRGVGGSAALRLLGAAFVCGVRSTTRRWR